jgi:hypothetical protein
MLILKFFLGLVCDTRAQRLSVRFSSMLRAFVAKFICTLIVIGN